MRRVLFAVALLVACGDDGDDGGSTSESFSGHLIALPDGTVTLCLGPIMESAPPRCGEPFLVVEGVDDPLSLPGTTDVGGWIEGDVTIEGALRGNRLVVS